MAAPAGSLAYGWQDVTTDRNVFLNQYRANFDASALSGRLETGIRIPVSTGRSRRMRRAGSSRTSGPTLTLASLV